MAMEKLCFCGKPITLSEKRTCTWCDWCGERVFAELADFATAVHESSSHSKDLLQEIKICNLHRAYYDLYFNEDAIKLGKLADPEIGISLLECAAERLSSTRIWYELSIRYSMLEMPERVTWAYKAIQAGDTRDPAYRESLIFLGMALDKRYNPDSWWKLSDYCGGEHPLTLYKSAFELDPSDAELAMDIYRQYDALADSNPAIYVVEANRYLHIAESLGSYEAKMTIERNQQIIEEIDRRQNERIAQEVSDMLDDVQNAMLAARAHFINKRF